MSYFCSIKRKHIVMFDLIAPYGAARKTELGRLSQGVKVMGIIAPSRSCLYIIKV